MKFQLMAGLASLVMLGASASADEIVFDGFPDFNSHLDVLIPDYEETHPGVSISYRMNQHGDHHKKLTTNLATGSGAGDVVVVDVSFVGSFINAGGFENLSSPEYGADAMAEDFVGYAWSQAKAPMVTSMQSLSISGRALCTTVAILPSLLVLTWNRSSPTGTAILSMVAS